MTVHDYGVNKSVHNLPALQNALSAINDNYLDVQQDILETFIDRGQLRRLAHDALAQILGLISKYLSLPTDELALKLRQFLRNTEPTYACLGIVPKWNRSRCSGPLADHGLSDMFRT